MGDLYYNFLGQALGQNVGLGNAEGEGSPSGLPTSDHPTNPSPAVPQLEERISQAIKSARSAFKAKQKQRAAAGKDCIRSSLDTACFLAAKVMDSWPSLVLPDVTSLSLKEWPGHGSSDSPTNMNPEGVTRPSPPANVELSDEVATTTISGTAVDAPVWILPSHSSVPPYKSWIGVKRNQLSLDNGLRMFYTEAETGETVPLSDDEGATIEQNDSRVLEGLQREETNAVIVAVVQSFQSDTAFDEDDVLNELSSQLGVSLEALERRVRELMGGPAMAPAVWEDKAFSVDALETDFLGAFCRMCRTFGCRIHRGGHPRPVMGPVSVEEERSRILFGKVIIPKDTIDAEKRGDRSPCGADCYRNFLAPSEREAEEAEERRAAEAAARNGQEEEEDEGYDSLTEGAAGGNSSAWMSGAAGGGGVAVGFGDVPRSTYDLQGNNNNIKATAAAAVSKGSEPEDNNKSRAATGGRKRVGTPGAAAGAGVVRPNSTVVDYGEVTSPAKRDPPPPSAQGGITVAAPSSIAAIDAILGGSIKGPRDNKDNDAAVRAAARKAAAEMVPEMGINQPLQRGSVPLPLSRRASGASGEGAGSAACSPPLPTNNNLKGFGGISTPAGAVGSDWQPWEDAALESGIAVWGRQPCKVALLVGTRTCTEVRARMMALLPSPMPGGVGVMHGTAGGAGGSEWWKVQGQNRRKRKGGARKTAYTSRNRPPAVVYQRLKRSTDEMWPQYMPCDCDGPCKETCPCRGDDNFCEKFCGCNPALCGNRFQGCQCKCGVTVGKRCSTRQCPCMAAGRECDPDLCKLCCNTVYGDHVAGYQCNNFRLRLRQKRRVLMGLSGVQGWGAFLGGPGVKKDEFIGEYCGELIDQAEADRRGKVYDRDDNSYLFNLNLEWVIDARQKGNKLRFANHSTAANCRAEILMVDGDHRVAILANKDLRPGEELFYDYRYDHRVAPDWAQDDGGRTRGRGRGRGRGR